MTTSEATRVCHVCGTTCGKNEFCPTCVAAFASRRNADDMTGDERVAEMRQLEIVTIPMDMIHQRIEELVGRPVWTSEVGLSWPRLLREAQDRQHPSFQDAVVRPLEELNMNISVVDLRDPEDR